MNKYLASLVLVLLPGILPAQKIFWSDISREDIIKASEISRSFLKHLEKQRVDSMEVFLMHDSVYVGDGTWLPEYVFLEKLMEQTRGIPLQNVKLTGYRFDDFLEQFEQHKILEKVYPVFDNHSILIQADYPGNRTGEQITLVLKNENGRWTITGLNGFGLSPGQPAGPVPAELGFRIEKIPEAGIVMPIPVDFSKPERVEGQVIFNLEDKTERDAVFQVLIDEYKTKVHYYTYKFVEFSNQQYDLSELVVRYLPYGIFFEYTVTDPYGTKNKGITMGMKSNDKMVVIQFYAFFDVFTERQQKILQVFNNIRR